MVNWKKTMMAAAGGAGPYWVAYLGSANSELSNAVAVDSGRNVITVGQTNATGGIDVLITKQDAAGSLLWSRSLGAATTKTDQGNDVAVDSSDNIIFVGNVESDGAGGSDFLIAKYNSSGTLQWSRSLGGSSDDIAYGVTLDSSDNIIVTGFTLSSGSLGQDGMIAKYNSSGTLQWDKTLRSSTSTVERIIEPATDSLGNIYGVGWTSAAGAGSDDYLIAKWNSSGTLQWSRTLGGASRERAHAITVDSSDNLVVVGQCASAGAGSESYLIAKYNSSGTLQWSRTLGSVSGAERGYSVAVDSADNIVVNGWTSSDGAGGYGFLIAKYNSSGVLQWDKNLGGSSTEFGWGVAIDSADDIIVAGQTSSGGSGGTDCLIAKLPPDGTGDGTYGPITYQDAGFTDAAASLTDSSISMVDTSITVTDAPAVLTSNTLSLTDTVYDI